jgi:hypothetical protein
VEVEYYAILTSYSIDQSHHKEDARDMGGELMCRRWPSRGGPARRCCGRPNECNEVHSRAVM